MMLRKRHEHGEGRLGCLFGVILLLAGLLVAYKMIPIKVKAAEIRDVVRDEAKSAGSHDDKRIAEAIIDKAKREGIPITKENIEIERTSSNSQIRVEVRYTVPVEFPGFTYQWNFHHKAENPVF
jgi:type III secretion system FlhB-like substrate exporter